MAADEKARNHSNAMTLRVVGCDDVAADDAWEAARSELSR